MIAMKERAGIRDDFVYDHSSPVVVLLVEDSELTRALIIKRLSEWNVSIIEAGSREHAIKLAGVSELDFALVDMRLPWPGNGIEVMKALRASDPNMPICAYSIEMRREDIAKICREIGVVTIADKQVLMEDEKYIRQLFSQFRLARRAGMEE